MIYNIVVGLKTNLSWGHSEESTTLHYVTSAGRVDLFAAEVTINDNVDALHETRLWVGRIVTGDVLEGLDEFAPKYVFASRGSFVMLFYAKLAT